MRKSVQMVLVLSTVGVVSGGALVGIYRYTQPRIEENRKRALRAAIFEVLPEAESYETIVKEGKTIYKGLDSSGRLIGYAFTGKGPGYQGTIEVMIGVDAELEETKGIEVLESVETPGLGAKITKKSFRDQFRDLLIRPLIQLIKGRPPEKPNQVQTITGATISSRAVVDILNETIREVRQILK
ncbi:MAG: RnfABCDGE type electron transport complex subunit G [bacterium]